MAWRIGLGQGDLLAGGAASVALGVLVFPLGFGLGVASLLAVGVYAGLVLVLPPGIDLRPPALRGGVLDDHPPEIAPDLQAKSRVALDAASVSPGLPPVSEPPATGASAAPAAAPGSHALTDDHTLGATGVPVPAHVAAARRLGLTPREHEIVIKLATSHPLPTNPELAAELCISPRTVDNHVSRVLDKLGLTSRRALPAFAAEHGLVPPVPPVALPSPPE